MSKIPIVVIAGRPNVGKSTLFNRLTKSKEAIVDDISGVTRDRNYGEVEWDNKVFRLIDTGGYVPESKDVFEAAIREQVHIAVDEADAVIFLVDSRTGITTLDYELTKILRLSSKKIFLAVNKVDSENYDSLTADFYKLGLGEPYGISAIGGRRLGDFLDALTHDFTAKEEETADDTQLKIALVGRPNVGKSSLTNSLLGYDRSIVTDIPGTTRDSINSILKYYGREIVLVDTAGLRKKAKVKENIEFYSTVRTLRAIAESSVVILMLDATTGLENQDQKILEEAVNRRRGIIIAVNKWDLVEKDTNTARQWELALYKMLGKYDYVPVIFISALTKQRIYKLIDLAQEVHDERLKKIPNDELNEILQEEIQKTPPPSGPTGKEIKIKFITQVGTYYPVFLFFGTQPKYLPDNYKRFLEKKIRERFGFKGVPMTLSFRQK